MGASFPLALGKVTASPDFFPVLQPHAQDRNQLFLLPLTCPEFLEGSGLAGDGQEARDDRQSKPGGFHGIELMHFSDGEIDRYSGNVVLIVGIVRTIAHSA